MERSSLAAVLDGPSQPGVAGRGQSPVGWSKDLHPAQVNCLSCRRGTPVP
jgi:hypothetical protein